jgi:hypothetical protein
VATRRTRAAATAMEVDSAKPMDEKAPDTPSS